MQGYKGFAELNRQATRRLRDMGMDQVARPVNPDEQPEMKPLFSELRELPRWQIKVAPEIFQGREMAYAEETVEKIMREGFDKSREPIVVWKAPDGKYIVISGHSRWEASERLYKTGDIRLETMPVKVFLGDLEDATDYALLESNREVTQEGLKSDLKAYKRARQRGYNREHLKGIFKPESRLRLLEDISYLNEQGRFLSYLGTEAEKSLPYLQRNAQWVGQIRKDVPALSNLHEEELFGYLYGLGADSGAAGKKKITISKDQFFGLVNAKVSRIDFDPEQALNLEDHVSTSSLTDPAKMEIQNIRAEIDKLLHEREKKDDLIARATAEGQQDLVEKFRQRQAEINQLITRRLLEIQKLEQQIGMLERTAVDLFSQAEEPSNTITTEDRQDRSDLPGPQTMNLRKQNMKKTQEETPFGQAPVHDKEAAREEFQINHMLPESPGDEPAYAWQITQQDYAVLKSELRTGLPNHIKAEDRKAHEDIVRQALAYQFSVPDEVLAEYPDLAKDSEAHISSESVQDAVMNPDRFIFDDNWFKAHPEKILGAVVNTTNQYHRPVTVVKGKLDDALQAINVPAVPTEVYEENPLETQIKEPLDNLLSDPQKKSNLEAVITDTLQEHADRAINRLKGKKDTYAEGCPEEYYCFDEIIASYNKGISADEIKAWIWYKRKSGGLNDEMTILKKSNGWSKYVVPLAEADRHQQSWLKNGILCFYKGDYIPSVLYYAENIHERLRELEQDKKSIIRLFGQHQYERQLKGLSDILPPALTLTDPKTSRRLFIKPDSSFAESTYIEGLADGTEVNRLPTEERIGLIEAFKAWLNARPKDEFKKTTNLDIISYYLEQNNPPRHLDDEEKLRVKQNAKKEGDALFIRFLAEALLPQDREAIEKRWNRIYNGYVEINYLKVPVGFTCSSTFKNKPLFIRQAQREGIGFISVHGSGCIAYDVGVGKTMTAILSLAQALEMGQCKRPFIVVPNATYKNWMAELRGKTENGKVVLTGLLPQYAINDLYNLSEDHLSLVLNEQRQVQQVAENTITLLTYEGFNRLCFNEATLNELGDELFEILHQGIEGSRNEEQMKENIKTLMGKGSRGGVVSVEDLGLDCMIVDEAHAMKKSFTHVRGEIKDNERQKATYDLQSGEPSMTALRGFMVSQYILRKNNMRNVQLLTATPFTNSPLEIYSMLALIAYQQLIQWGIRNLKDFFDTFIRTSIELTINSKLKPERKEVVLGFNNLIALQQLIFKFITYKSGEDALIQRPNKVVLPLLNHTVDGALVPLPQERQVSTNLPMTAEQKNIMSRIELFILGLGDMGELCNSAGMEEHQSGKGIELREANMSKEEKEKARVLRGLSFARQVALSPYLFACNSHKTPTYRQYIETSPTLSYVMGCIRSVKEYHEHRNEPVSGQVIYMNAGVQYFPLIKDYLVKAIGYDESEIGIVSSGISVAKKEGIKERFLAGSIKIIIGSASIREGINLQNRSTVLYNCWLDWNPTDVKQLEGRIWRYGNMFANVRIVIPLLEDSIVMFIFQKLEEKTSRINEIWYRAGKENALDLEDINPSELKMGLVTNPRMLAELMLVREKEEIEDEIIRLNNQRTIISSIHQSREKFKKHLPYIRQRADKYKPPRAGSSERMPSTLLKIFRDYLDDEQQNPSWKDQEAYRNISSAYHWMQRGLHETLEPRGLDLDFDEKTVLNKVDQEIKALKKKQELEVGQDAVAKKEAEIIKERKRKGYQRKTVAERVEEFAKMNPAMLSELMVYDDTPEASEKQRQQDQLGRDLESTSDALEEMEDLVAQMEEMEKILAEMESLQAA